MENTPRGIRNNNPGNIRGVAGHLTWQGQTGVDDAGFCTFTDAHNGLRALAKTLDTYECKYNLNTVREIIGRYAPPSENDTDAYELAVAKHLNVGLDDDIGTDAQTFDIILAGIIMHENGVQPYSEEEITAAVNDALGIAGGP